MKLHIIFCILSFIVGFASIFLSITETIEMNRFVSGLVIFACGSLFGDSFWYIFDSCLRRDYGDRRNKD